MIRHFEAALTAEKLRMENSIPISPLPTDALVIVKQLWPDQGLSFQAGKLLGGLTSNIQKAVDDLFTRFVAAQSVLEPTDARRDNDDVWGVFSSAFSRYDIVSHLRPKQLEQDGLQYRFDHTLQNGKLHIFEPLSLDYKQLSTLRSRVSEVIGDAVSVRDNPDVGNFNVLLGKPRSTSLLSAYNAAKLHLRKTLRNPQAVVEEDEAEAFAQQIAAVLPGHPQ